MAMDTTQRPGKPVVKPWLKPIISNIFWQHWLKVLSSDVTRRSGTLIDANLRQSCDWTSFASIFVRSQCDKNWANLVSIVRPSSASIVAPLWQSCESSLSSEYVIGSIFSRSLYALCSYGSHTQPLAVLLLCTLYVLMSISIFFRFQSLDSVVDGKKQLKSIQGLVSLQSPRLLTIILFPIRVRMLNKKQTLMESSLQCLWNWKWKNARLGHVPVELGTWIDQRRRNINGNIKCTEIIYSTFTTRPADGTVQ